jgi:hypothetical protein
MILYNNLSFYDGGIIVGIRIMSKLSACQRIRERTNNVFTVRNVICPHKDYSSFLGGKLIVFKLCNYVIVLAKV